MVQEALRLQQALLESVWALFDLGDALALALDTGKASTTGGAGVPAAEPLGSPCPPEVVATS
eukprot:1189077-Prorocentrum_lima.AAC.1